MVWEMLYNPDYSLPTADAVAAWHRAMDKAVEEEEVRADGCHAVGVGVHACSRAHVVSWAGQQRVFEAEHPAFQLLVAQIITTSSSVLPGNLSNGG
jgi:hypothetical protein